MGVQVFIFIMIGLAASVASAWYLRASYTVWIAGNWLIIASLSWDLSSPRYTLAMFPFLFSLLWQAGGFSGCAC
jgi:hypothetical protein